MRSQNSELEGTYRIYQLLTLVLSDWDPERIGDLSLSLVEMWLELRFKTINKPGCFCHGKGPFPAGLISTKNLALWSFSFQPIYFMVDTDLPTPFLYIALSSVSHTTEFQSTRLPQWQPTPKRILPRNNFNKRTVKINCTTKEIKRLLKIKPWFLKGPFQSYTPTTVINKMLN